MNEKRKLTYDVILEPSDEGRFTVYAPALPGCVSEGDSEEEALENIKDAIALWLDSWEDVAVNRGAVIKKVTIER
jgi:predicted RNase H-like HicB family nuclease